ncbi:FAD-dependent oxidoreductase [Endothiovibrio diazotrophicus]
MTTDVLVIGAGGAGLRAAIEADDRGVDVRVVSKGAFPAGCNTILAGGVMLAPLAKADSAEKYRTDTLRNGAQMNYPHLVQRLVEEAAERARDLKRFGTEQLEENGQFDIRDANGCSVPRALPAGRPYSGDWIKGLVEEVRRREIPVHERIMVVDLLKTDGAVSGAVGIDLQSGALCSFAAKTVVLASGGGGHLYAFSTNAPGITGDGYALAYRAGARLSHMEFVQMRQCIIHPPALKGVLPPFDGFVSTGGRLYNGLHERYMRRYHPDRLERVTRAELARCAQLEIMAGRQSPHGGIYGDLSDVPSDQLNRVEKFTRACAAAGIDPAWQPYEWSLAAHHFMGGVVIDERCATGVPGLFAAGEVVAGVHGANRMGGNALTETQVFGAIAGRSAATAAQASAPTALRRPGTDALRQRVVRLRDRNRGTDHRAVRRRVVETISQFVGVIRNGDGLRTAVERIEAIRNRDAEPLSLLGERSPDALAAFFETENILLLGALMARAALRRTESRGAHQREDYPETSEAWRKHIVFHQENGRMRMTEVTAEAEKGMA